VLNQTPGDLEFDITTDENFIAVVIRLAISGEKDLAEQYILYDDMVENRALCNPLSSDITCRLREVNLCHNFGGCVLSPLDELFFR
jgi:hypothetical protein